MRVSEVYASVQGEGPRTGQTTVFVRFGGCNLRCPGWPCDTQHAIDPKYRKEWVQESWAELFERVHEVAREHGARLITLTGGEPFLQPNGELEYFVMALKGVGYQVEAFTNGTLEYPQWAVRGIDFIIDWKLPGSGEYEVGVEQRLQNLRQLSYKPGQVVKFVCLDWTDFQTALDLYELWKYDYPNLIWYYGKVWNTEDLNDAELVDNVMSRQLPWRLNVQLHNYIWDPQERGR